MMRLHVDIKKKLPDFSLEVCFEDKEGVLGLLGASGAGKSLLLKCIAGIEKPDEGQIILNDCILFDSEKGINVIPQKRKAGYLFQDYALFPNMNVYENIRCILPKGVEGNLKTIKIIEQFDLGEIQKRYPAQMSGGEKQKTALARIVASNPQLLLLDEPLSAMDSQLRFRMEEELKHTVRELGIPTVLVTHNRDEAYRMCQDIAVLKKGRICELNSKEDIFNHPKTREAAFMTGCKNIAPCKEAGRDNYEVPDWGISLSVPAGECGLYVGVRMRKIKILNNPEENYNNNVFSGRIKDIIDEPFDRVVMVVPDGGRQALGIVVEKRTDFCVDDIVRFYIPEDGINLLSE